MSEERLSDLELIRACARSNDGPAWEEFVSRFHRPIALSIHRTARRWGPVRNELVDDLVQQAYLKLCERHCQLLLDFAERNPDNAPAYVKKIAINLTLDHFKSAHSLKHGEGKAQEPIEHIDPAAARGSLGGPEAMERQVLLRQVDECLKQCSAGPTQERDCNIFWLCYRQGMSASEIAALPSTELGAKGVESLLRRLLRMVTDCLVAADPDGNSSPADG